MAALVGSFLGVRYNVAGGPLYHVRYVCASAADPAFPYDLVIRTPDGDTYEERFNHQQSIMDVKIASDFQTIPGVPADQIYPFRAAPTPQEEVVWKATGAAVVAGVIPGLLRPVGGHAPGQNLAGPADALRGPLGIQLAAGGAIPAGGGPAPAGGGAALPLPASGTFKLNHDFSSGTLQWVMAESCKDLMYGSRVDVNLQVVRGERRIVTLQNYGEVFIKCLDGCEVRAYLDEPAHWDIRTLPVIMSPVGKPERTLQSVGSTMKEEAVLWELPGKIRSAMWCIMFLISEAIGFEAHHERIRQLAGVDGGAWGIAEHLQLMLMLRAAILVDQLDPANNMFIEILFRRVQTIEYSWSERIADREAKASAGGRMSLEEQALFGGLTRSSSAIMICPALINFVKEEAERDGKLQKALRLAREERENRAAGGKGGRNGKKDEKKGGD